MQITGGTVLLGSDGLQTADLHLHDGRISFDGPATGSRFDASGLLVLPGIVDLHGDAFERQLQPRPGVNFPVDLALRDTESQLLANGITTGGRRITLTPWIPPWPTLKPAASTCWPSMIIPDRSCANCMTRWRARNTLAGQA